MTSSYGQLNAIGDEEREKSLGSHKTFQLLNIYMKRSFILGHALFEGFDVSSKKKIGLKS